jgi:hypothetical protein
VVDSLGIRSLLAVVVGQMAAGILVLSWVYRDGFGARGEGAILSMGLGSLAVIRRSARWSALFHLIFLLLAGWQLSLINALLLVIRLERGSQLACAVGAVMAAGGLLKLLINPGLGAVAESLGPWSRYFPGRSRTRRADFIPSAPLGRALTGVAF